ncbi:MAG: glycosyltransferase [Bacteroidales bacterium]|jgi:glycosyltransferase involved in cell wall biosynthesis|nr:glycosyltransferase [Bacteroidales bacterium]
MRITLLGTAYPFRGGLALYNERLMEEFQREGQSVSINTFTLQYPAFLFPGKTQYATWEKTYSFAIKRRINSINPLNWLIAGHKIKKEQPDIVIIKYWMPFFAPCFYVISKIIKRRRKSTKVIAIVDNIIPHEKRFFDTFLTKLFVRCVDGFVAMSQAVYDDIALFDRMKPRILSPHPLFDNFGTKISKDEALEKLNLNKDDVNLLFFGLIREYKGLDLLLEALADERLKAYPIKLVVAGEFYDDKKTYFDLAERLKIENKVRFEDKFIADDEVKNYFCASDLVVLPYKSATQSGVTQIGYHFEKPMLVTDVGGLSEIIVKGKTGYVTQSDRTSIADAIFDFCSHKPDFSEGITNEKKRYAWSAMTDSIKSLYKTIIDNDNKK